MNNITGLCAVGRRMKQCDHWTTSDCFACGKEDTIYHVWRCPERDTRWHLALQSIDLHLERSDNKPSTQAKILETLSIVQLRIRSTLMSTLLNKRAASAQETTGLTHTLLGEWSLQWNRLKERHYQRKGSQCSGNKWFYNLLKVTVT